VATITKRGEYQWQAKIRRVGWPEVAKTFLTREDAQEWAREIEGEMRRGVFAERKSGEKTSLKKLIEQYVDDVVPKHRGADSEKLRCLMLSRLALAERMVATLTPNDFVRYRDARLKERKPATVERELQIFQSIIETARREWGIWLPSNPVSQVSRPKFNNERDRRLLDGEEEKLLNACEPAVRRPNGTFEKGTRLHWLKPIVVLAIETAMRRGELLSLEWSQVNLDRRVATLLKTKNGHVRKVPLSTRAVETFQSIPASNEEKVFSCSENEFKLAWRRTLKRAKESHLADCASTGQKRGLYFVDLRFHDLRHEATSRMAKKLPNVIELSRVTGHRDLNMLGRYYHTDPEDLARKLG